MSEPRKCTVEDCSNPIPTGARGVAKYCLEHRGKKSATTAKPVSKTTSKTKTKSLTEIEESLEGLFAFIGLGLMPFNQEDAKVIISRASPNAKALISVAKENEKFRKTLENLLNVSAYGQLIAAVAATAIPIAANHGLIKREISDMTTLMVNKFSVSIPDDLSTITDDVG